MSLPEAKLFVGAVGVIFEVTFKDQDGAVIDISSMTANTLTFRKSSGAGMTKTGVLSTDGSDGKLRYVTIVDDLNEAGWWKLQGDITLTGWDGPSNIVEFEVFKNL